MEKLITPDGKYRLELRNMTLWAFQNSPRMVTETRIQNGQVTVVQKPYAETFRCDDPDLFHASWAREGDWDADVDCGAMRCSVRLPPREFNKGLRELGFTEDQIWEAVKAAKEAYEEG